MFAPGECSVSEGQLDKIQPLSLLITANCKVELFLRVIIISSEKVKLSEIQRTDVMWTGVRSVQSISSKTHHDNIQNTFHSEVPVR